MSDDPNPPLLVTALDDHPVAVANTAQPDSLRLQGMQFYKNLSGEFDVRVPGNFWLKGKDMDIELSGDLKAVLRDELVDLFGSLEVRRGYYKLYGKRLNFERGTITLTGGQDLDPSLDVAVIYQFRDIDRQLRSLRLSVTGKAGSPQFGFQLDNQEIEEKDAIAYLIFGRTLDQLDEGQRSSLGDSSAGLAGQLALGQVSAALQGALQSSLNLDVVEISTGDSWRSGSISIGKYITNNLFLSYQRSFALDKKTKLPDTDRIALEYQIFRSLFFQAVNQNENSGFDFILRRNWK